MDGKNIDLSFKVKRIEEHLIALNNDLTAENENFRYQYVAMNDEIQSLRNNIIVIQSERDKLNVHLLYATELLTQGLTLFQEISNTVVNCHTRNLIENFKRKVIDFTKNDVKDLDTAFTETTKEKGGDFENKSKSDSDKDIDATILEEIKGVDFNNFLTPFYNEEEKKENCTLQERSSYKNSSSETRGSTAVINNTPSPIIQAETINEASDEEIVMRKGPIFMPLHVVEKKNYACVCNRCEESSHTEIKKMEASTFKPNTESSSTSEKLDEEKVLPKVLGLEKNTLGESKFKENLGLAINNKFKEIIRGNIKTLYSKEMEDRKGNSNENKAKQDGTELSSEKNQKSPSLLMTTPSSSDDLDITYVSPSVLQYYKAKHTRKSEEGPSTSTKRSTDFPREHWRGAHENEIKKMVAHPCHQCNKYFKDLDIDSQDFKKIIKCTRHGHNPLSQNLTPVDYWKPYLTLNCSNEGDDSE